MVDGIESLFPRLAGSQYRITSPRDDVYNCIAWAAGAMGDWWWPIGVGRTHWPDGVPRVASLDSFQKAFATVGYSVCTSEEPEPGIEKIALFADAQRKPTHAARQLPSGRWTSKLGRAEDIEHALHDLEGMFYGFVALVMRRPHAPMETGLANP
jgi:hypothetical protein